MNIKALQGTLTLSAVVFQTWIDQIATHTIDSVYVYSFLSLKLQVVQAQIHDV